MSDRSWRRSAKISETNDGSKKKKTWNVSFFPFKPISPELTFYLSSSLSPSFFWLHSQFVHVHSHRYFQQMSFSSGENNFTHKFGKSLGESLNPILRTQSTKSHLFENFTDCSIHSFTAPRPRNEWIYSDLLTIKINEVLSEETRLRMKVIPVWRSLCYHISANFLPLSLFR